MTAVSYENNIPIDLDNIPPNVVKINTLLDDVDSLIDRINSRVNVVSVKSTDYTVYILENLKDDLRIALKNLKLGK